MPIRSNTFPVNSNQVSVHLLTTKLLQYGISPEGARQALAGETITNLADRSRIVQFIHAEKNQDIEVENDETHFVGQDKAGRAGRTETVDNKETMTIHKRLVSAGVSANAAQQVLAAQPITNAADRRAFAVWMTVG